MLDGWDANKAGETGSRETGSGAVLANVYLKNSTFLGEQGILCFQIAARLSRKHGSLCRKLPLITSNSYQKMAGRARDGPFVLSSGVYDASRKMTHESPMQTTGQTGTVQ